MKIRKISVISCVSIIIFSFLLTAGFCQDKGHLEAGKRMYNEGRFEEALKEFIEALQEDPTSEEITKYIDKTQIKIKELIEISRALVRDDKIAVRGREIKDVKIEPAYYDQELKNLAEKMTKLIEKTKGKAGETRKTEILESKKAEERIAEVKEYFEKGQKLYNEGKAKHAIAMWEKALEIAKKGGPEITNFIDTLNARIETEKETQVEDERKEALLASETKRKEEALIKERAAKEKEGREKALLAYEKAEGEKAKQKRETEVKIKKEEKGEADKKTGPSELQKTGHGLKRHRIRTYARRGGILFVVVFFALLALLLIKSQKKLPKEIPGKSGAIKPPEVTKKEKIFEQAPHGKGIFRARKLRDNMKKKRKDIFEKEDDK